MKSAITLRILTRLTKHALVWTPSNHFIEQAGVSGGIIRNQFYFFPITAFGHFLINFFFIPLDKISSRSLSFSLRACKVQFTSSSKILPSQLDPPWNLGNLEVVVVMVAGRQGGSFGQSYPQQLFVFLYSPRQGLGVCVKKLQVNWQYCNVLAICYIIKKVITTLCPSYPA